MATNKKLKIALIQSSVYLDKEKTVTDAIHLIREAYAKYRPRLVALPECFNGPYVGPLFNKFAEEIPKGYTSQLLSQLAAELKIYIIGGSIPERSGTKLYNTCVVWGPDGSLVAKHRKVHMADVHFPPVIDLTESDFFTAGNQATTFTVDGFKVGIAICYDMFFDEYVRLLKNDGCNIIFDPSAYGVTFAETKWELINRSRALLYQVYVAGIQSATDYNSEYPCYGHSLIVDPHGTVLDSLDDKEGIAYAEIDYAVLAEVEKGAPMQKQRRTDLYETVKKI